MSLATINPLVLGKQDDGTLLVVNPARDTKKLPKRVDIIKKTRYYKNVVGR